MNLALTLLPLIPGLITGVLNIVNAIKNHPATPADAKETLQTISNKLEETLILVADLEIKPEQPE